MDLQSSSVEDDIAAAISATETAPAAPSAGAAPPSDAPAEPTSSTAVASEGERARDAQGRFQPKPADGDDKQKHAPAETATGAPQQAQTPAPATGQQQPAGAERVAPPLHWKGNEKIVWDRLPKPVQQAIADDYKRVTETESKFANLQNVLAPHEQGFRLNYGSTEAGLQNLLAISGEANKNPAGFIAWFAQQRGIDLASLAQQIVGQGGIQQPTQHQPQSLTAEQVQQIAQRTWEQQQTQSRQSQAQTDIQAFAADKAHPYFNDVRPHMAALMQSNAATTLQEAYDSACWANPQIRAALIKEQTERNATDVAEAERQKVANAKRAGGSLTGSPSGASVAPDGPFRKTTEEEVRYQAERILSS